MTWVKTDLTLLIPNYFSIHQIASLSNRNPPGIIYLMQEYFTPALVLDLDEADEYDRLVYFYSKELGRVRARAKSARKITSKLSSHLQPLCFSRVRLVEKKGFQIADAVLIKKISPSPESLSIALFIKEMTVELQPDKKLWVIIKKSFDDLRKKKFSYRPLLEELGFSPKFATCRICNRPRVSAFNVKEQIFFCDKCVSKIPANGVIFI